MRRLGASLCGASGLGLALRARWRAVARKQRRLRRSKPWRKRRDPGGIVLDARRSTRSRRREWHARAAPRPKRDQGLGEPIGAELGEGSHRGGPVVIASSEEPNRSRRPVALRPEQFRSGDRDMRLARSLRTHRPGCAGFRRGRQTSGRGRPGGRLGVPRAGLAPGVPLMRTVGRKGGELQMASVPASSADGISSLARSP